MTTPVIDVHTHLAPAPATLAGVAGIETDGDGRLVVDGRRLGLPGLYAAAALTGSLAAHGLDGAWVSAPPPLYRQGLDAADTETWVRALDAGMRERLAGHDALGLLSYLPLDQPKVALALAEATVDSVGWTGSAGGGSLPLDDPAVDPLLEHLAAVGKPLLLHPGHSPDPRLEPLYLANLLGNPVETGVAAGQLLLGGVLDRHPELRVVLVHCGGVVPTLLGRWAQGVATSRDGIPEDATDPRDGARSLWVDTLAHSPAVVDLALEVFGPDRLLLGSDYPFPMGVADPFESVAHLDPALQMRIGRNAAHLLTGGRAA